MDNWFKMLREENLKWWDLTVKRGWAKGIRASIVDKYPDPLHCLFELIQNAEDQNATHIRLLVTHSELVFTHNGEAFCQSDVERITGIGISEKESNKIGRFGIGFKSVFVISDFPEIYADLQRDSGTGRAFFGFGIRDLVVPERVDLNPAFYEKGMTTFRFKLKPAEREDTVAKLQEKLPELGADILLFLRKIEEIRWETPVAKGIYSCPRSAKDDQTAFVRRVRLRSEIDNRGEKPTVRNFNYLLFSRRIEESSTDREVFVKIAFLLDGKSDVCRDPRSGFLNVYFPTEERTFVGFRMHGPYLLTDNRANVKLQDQFNERLIRETAQLVHESMVHLRDRKRLKVDAISLLPIQSDNFSPGSLFFSHYSTILLALREDALLPTSGGGYVSAPQAVIARADEIRTLFSGRQLKDLYRREKMEWLSAEITETGRYKDLHSYLTITLGIKELRPEIIAEQLRLRSDFFEGQSISWLIRFYKTLNVYYGENRIWKAFRQTPFIRLEEGTHVKLHDPGHFPTAYLPVAGVSELPFVNSVLARDRATVKFLEKIGIGRPSNHDSVEYTLIPEYRNGDVGIEDTERLLDDLEAFVAALDSCSESQRQKLQIRLDYTPFLLAWNATSKERALKTPNVVYIPSEELRIYSEGANIWFLDDLYNDRRALTERFAVSSKVRVVARECDSIRNVVVADSHGFHERGLDGFDPAASIDGLEALVNAPTIAKARYLWNEILLKVPYLIKGIVEKSSYQSYAHAKQRECYSVVGELLVRYEWLPDREGNFHRPADLGLGDLPDTFVRTDTVAQKLGMKSSTLVALAEDEDLDPEDVRIALDLLKTDPEMKRILERARERARIKITEPAPQEGRIIYGDELGRRFNQEEIPRTQTEEAEPHEVANPERKLNRQSDRIKEAQGDEPRPNARIRRVERMVLEGKDYVNRATLLHYYGGKCQICDSTFRKRDGEPYFEAYYLVARKRARWLDHVGNLLCLCPTCGAKLEYGEVEAPEMVDELRKMDIRVAGKYEILMELCGEPVILTFSHAHAIAIRALISADNPVSGKEGVLS